MDKIKEVVDKRVREKELVYQKMYDEMNNSVKRKLKGTTELIERVKLVEDILKEHLHFIREIEKNKIKIYEDFKEQVYNNRFILSEVYGRNYKSDFQIYTASIANDYLQEWLNKNNIQKNYEIRLRNLYSFPSTYAIYLGEFELMQFNLGDKWYGIRVKGIEDKELERKYEEDLKELEDRAKKAEKDLLEWEEALKHPYKTFKGIKNKLNLITKNKTVKEALEDKVHVKREWLISTLIDIEMRKKQHERDKENNKLRLDAEKDLVKFFEELGYSLMEQKEKLY